MSNEIQPLKISGNENQSIYILCDQVLQKGDKTKSSFND